MTTPRGIRNNNPGNVRRSVTVWRGQSEHQTDSAFVQFVSMAYGVRALAVILRAYVSKHNLHTLTGIIWRWAPPIENNTAAYVAAVAKATGFDPHANLNLNDPATLRALAKAIIEHEDGRDIAWSDIVAGVALALGAAPPVPPVDPFADFRRRFP
jgi:hypothetical protein